MSKSEKVEQKSYNIKRFTDELYAARISMQKSKKAAASSSSNNADSGIDISSGDEFSLSYEVKFENGGDLSRHFIQIIEQNPNLLTEEIDESKTPADNGSDSEKESESHVKFSLIKKMVGATIDSETNKIIHHILSKSDYVLSRDDKKNLIPYIANQKAGALDTASIKLLVLKGVKAPRIEKSILNFLQDKRPGSFLKDLAIAFIDIKNDFSLAVRIIEASKKHGRTKLGAAIKAVASSIQNSMIENIAISTQSYVPSFIKVVIDTNDDDFLRQVISEAKKSRSDFEAILNGNNLLHYVIQKRYTATFRILIENGFENFQEVNHEGQNPFIYACSFERSSEFLESYVQAIKEGCKGDDNKVRTIINQIDKNEKNAFDYAVESGYLRQVKFLAENGANIDYDKSLSTAIDNQNPRVFKFLLKDISQKGINISDDLSSKIVSHLKKIEDPILAKVFVDFAKDKKSLLKTDDLNKLKELSNKIEKVKKDFNFICRNFGADYIVAYIKNYLTDHGSAAASSSSDSSSSSISSSVISYNPSPSPSTSPRVVFDKESDATLISTLINQKDNEGLTPLYHAVRGKCYADSVKVLLESGANPNLEYKVKAKDGTISKLTVFDMVEKEHPLALAELLKCPQVEFDVVKDCSQKLLEKANMNAVLFKSFILNVQNTHFMALSSSTRKALTYLSVEYGYVDCLDKIKGLEGEDKFAKLMNERMPDSGLLPLQKAIMNNDIDMIKRIMPYVKKDQNLSKNAQDNIAIEIYDNFDVGGEEIEDHLYDADADDDKEEEKTRLVTKNVKSGSGSNSYRSLDNSSPRVAAINGSPRTVVNSSMVASSSSISDEFPTPRTLAAAPKAQILEEVSDKFSYLDFAKNAKNTEIVKLLKDNGFESAIPEKSICPPCAIL